MRIGHDKTLFKSYKSVSATYFPAIASTDGSMLNVIEVPKDGHFQIF